jgi:hypothetical protein
MQAKAGFLQMFPTLAQTIFNPEMLTLLAQQQKKTLNVELFERSIMDALNYTFRGNMFIPMSDVQKQAMQQPPPAEKLKAMIAQMQEQSNMSIHDKQNITKLLTQFLKDGFKHTTEMHKLDEAGRQHDTQLAQDAAQADADRAADTGADEGAGGPGD